jgi:hypothetical protein
LYVQSAHVNVVAGTNKRQDKRSEWLHVSLVGALSGSRCMTVHDAADNVIVYIREEGQWAVANALRSVSPADRTAIVGSAPFRALLTIPSTYRSTSAGLGRHW